MINLGYQESVVKKSMGNNLNTAMFKTYVAPGKRQIDDEFLTQTGDQKNEMRRR
jgi:hypothetical protein